MRGHAPPRTIVLAAVLAATVLCGCGGGGEDSGPATAGAEARRAAAELRRAERRQAELEAAVRRARAEAEQGGRQVDRPAGGAGGDGPVAARRSFRELEASLGGQVGLSISGLGQAEGRRFGSLSGGVAWSTIKVPLAQAALDAGRASEGDVSAAITASDNTAAERLWASLGSGRRAAAAVQAVLAGNGDSSTVVNPVRTRPGFSAFGQTEWTLDAQRAFISSYVCSHRGSRITSLMGQVVPGQQWGLGAVGREAGYKGGWGPAPSGPYLVRQMGWIRLGGGRTAAVAMAVIAPSGTYEAGAQALSRVAEWLTANVSGRDLGGGGC